MKVKERYAGEVMSCLALWQGWGCKKTRARSMWWAKVRRKYSGRYWVRKVGGNGNAKATGRKKEERREEKVEMMDKKRKVKCENGSNGSIIKTQRSLRMNSALLFMSQCSHESSSPLRARKL